MSKQFTKPNKHAAAQSRQTMERVFEEAQAEIAQGRIALVNLDGDLGKEALEHVSAILGKDQSVASWVGNEEADNAAGNCFFATTQMMLHLMNANRASNFKLASGEFHHKDAKEAIIHAWLEYSRAGETVVVNVSNLKQRPLYAMDKATYLDTNRCRVKLQRLEPKDVLAKLKTFVGGPVAGADIDVRGFTKLLLRKTLHQRLLQSTGRRK